MTKRVRLTERQMNKAINEISYGTVDDANSINFNSFWKLQNGSREIDYADGFDNFYNNLERLESAFKEFTPNLPEDSTNPNINKIKSLVSKLSNYLMAIRTCSDEINNIFLRKENQRNNFDDAISKYDKVHGDDDVSFDEYKRGEINNI